MATVIVVEDSAPDRQLMASLLKYAGHKAVLCADGQAGLDLIKKVKPKYPKEARKQRIEGVVVLSGKITKDGDVADLTLVSGAPYSQRQPWTPCKNGSTAPIFFWENR